MIRANDRAHAPSRLIGLQYLRGVAAMAVLAFHVCSSLGMEATIGEAGVDLFFVLSGFLMVAITGPETRPRLFLADRVRRIVPSYWLATAVMAAGTAVHLFRRARFDAPHLIASLLFVPHRDVLTGKVWPTLVPGWTLNYEMMFYVTFAAAMALRDQTRRVLVLTWLFAAFVVAGAILKPATAIAQFYSAPIILEFVGGCWVGLVWKGALSGRAAWRPALGGACAVALALALGYRDQPLFHLYAGFGGLLALAAVLRLERDGRVGRARLPLLVGDASYSIYLWHTLATAALIRLVTPLALPIAAAAIIVFLAGLAAGIAAYLAIERPVLRFFRERRYVRGVPVPAGP